MISDNLKEAILLAEDRDPILNELFGMKPRHEKLEGVEKEYYDLYQQAGAIKFDKGWGKAEMNKLRRLVTEMGKIKKEHPDIHNQVFTVADRLAAKWNRILARRKKSKALAKEAKDAARDDDPSDDD